MFQRMISRSIRHFVVIVGVFCAIQLAGGQESSQEPRTALVVGNAEYQYFGTLKNPANDAEDIAATLDELGFDVTMLLDAGRQELALAVRAFGDRLADSGGLGLFYYAGHGIEVGGTNYLIPSDADVAAEDEVEFNSIPLDLVVEKMATAQNGQNIVILDACRDNPLPATRRSASATRGLSVVEAPTGTLIVYATEPGRAALDGDGRNSPFTGAFLNHVQTPGVDVEIMMRSVRQDVISETDGEQTPWTNSSLTGSIILARAEAVEPVVVEPEPEQPVVSTSQPTVGRVQLDVPDGREIVAELSNVTDGTLRVLGAVTEVPPGEYVLRARYADDEDWAEVRPVVVDENQAVSVSLGNIGYSATHQINELSSIRADLQQALIPQITRRETLTTLGWITLGTGIAGAGASVATFILGSEAYDRYANAVSTTDAVNSREEYQNYSTLFAISAGVGGAFLAATPLLWLLRPDTTESESELEDIEGRIEELEAQR